MCMLKIPTCTSLEDCNVCKTCLAVLFSDVVISEALPFAWSKSLCLCVEEFLLLKTCHLRVLDF